MSDKVKDLLKALEDSINAAKAERRAVSETYVTDPDDGDERVRSLNPTLWVQAAPDGTVNVLAGRLDDADERTVIERTDSERQAFAAKMAEWRRTGGVPGYTGPKAAR